MLGMIVHIHRVELTVQNVSSNNNYSMNFDGNNDYIDIIGVFNPSFIFY